MGGHALSVESIRLPAKQYHDIAGQLLSKINAALPGKKACVIQAYRNKQDFGDVDILIEGGEGYDPHKLANALGATEVVRNGDVTSIGIYTDAGIFQVDLIKATAESFEFSKNYFSFNDLGNLLGRIGHKAGFKLGHAGLLYPLRNPDNSTELIAELVVTKDWMKAIKLFGYSIEEFKKQSTSGFNDLEDIFKFVVSSPYFNHNIYLLENRNAISRVRDAKRPTYTKFLAWCKDNKNIQTFPSFDWQNKDYQRLIFLYQARHLFPVFAEQYDDSMQKFQEKKFIREKFNGQLVSELTGLTGRELGEFMQQLKNSVENLNEFILNSNCETIEKFVATEYAKADFLRGTNDTPDRCIV